ncbi:MAG TPA: carboxypeptidase-like regulatory domain-containing protein, partial [Mycobacterium sp.]
MTSRAWIASTSAKALIAVLFAALFFFGLQAPAAHAAGEVDLTVNVKTKAGTAIPGLEVIAYEVQNHHSDFSQFVEGVPLSSAGTYKLDNLDLNQDYALYFYVNTKSTAFDQFYGGRTWVEEATLLRWSVGGAKNLSITLATNTTITGKVSISSTTGLAKVRVVAYRFDGTGWFDVAEVLTGSTGNYALRNLEPGSYKLKFEPDNLKGYAPKYSGGGASLQTASSIYTGLGSTTTVNMRLVKGAGISGTVGLYPFTYNSTGIVPVAYRVLGDAINGYTGIDKSDFYLGPKVASGCTGTVVYCKWTVPGLPAGAYVVKLYDFSGLLPYYEPMWVDYGDGTDIAATARIFTVSGSSSVTATPSTVLKTVGDIAVTSLDITVQNPVGDPVENAYVVLESEGNNDAERAVSTDAAGIAHFDRIGEGDFIAEITTDDATTHYQPDLNSFTITGTGTHTMTLGLAALTAFSFTAPASVSWSNTTVGSQFTAVVPKTTMDNGSGAEQDVDYDYQWYRGTTAIFGANDDQYVTKSGDVGSTVSVVVSASSFGYPDITEIAQAGAPTTPGTPAHSTTPPSITSTSAAKPG